MIAFSNGRQAEVFAASGALGWDGRGWAWERRMPKQWLDPKLFWAASKTITWSRRQGNGHFSWLNVRPLFRDGKLVGWVNALGMPGPGFHEFLRHLASYDLAGLNYMVSLASIEGDRWERVTRLQIMVAALQKTFSGQIAAIELNVSCPNTENGKMPDADDIESLVMGAKGKTTLPLIVKLSVAQDYCEIARRLERRKLVEAISINSVPWKMAFPNRTSPLAKFGGGGVSGKIAQVFTWEMVRKLSEASSVPVIAPGIWNYEDIEHVMNVGASAVHFGSVFIASPWFPTQAVRRWREEQSMVQKSN